MCSSRSKTPVGSPIMLYIFSTYFASHARSDRGKTRSKVGSKLSGVASVPKNKAARTAVADTLGKRCADMAADSMLGFGGSTKEKKEKIKKEPIVNASYIGYTLGTAPTQ